MKENKPYWEKRLPGHLRNFEPGFLHGTDYVHAVMEEENCVFFHDYFCKRTGCKRNCPKDISCRLKKEDGVLAYIVPKKLRDLIIESAGQMLFVEHDDPRFSDDDLLEFEMFVMIRHPEMEKAVDVSSDRTGDALITIYPDAFKMMYDPKDFVYDEFPGHAGIGTKVTSKVVDYFRNLIPPVVDYENFMQVGSPYEHLEDVRSKTMRGTYRTFKRISDNVWELRGNCFLGEDIPAREVKEST